MRKLGVLLAVMISSLGYAQSMDEQFIAKAKSLKLFWVANGSTDNPIEFKDDGSFIDTTNVEDVKLTFIKAISPTEAYYRGNMPIYLLQKGVGQKPKSKKTAPMEVLLMIRQEGSKAELFMASPAVVEGPHERIPKNDKEWIAFVTNTFKEGNYRVNAGTSIARER